MKKITFLLGNIFIISNIYAAAIIETTTNDTNNIVSTANELFNNFKIDSDILPNNQCTNPNPKCFNAGEEVLINGKIETHIKTKIAGNPNGIQIHLRHRAGCGWTWANHIAAVLVDNTTGNLITEPKEIDPTTTDDDIIATFDVKNAYKNVSVRFLHIKPIKCDFHNGFKLMHKCQNQVQNTISEPINIQNIINQPFVINNEFQCFEVNASNYTNFGEEINCPTDISDIKDNLPTINDLTEKYNANHQFKFYYAIPKQDQCYNIYNPCDANTPYISQSDDSFAIKPDHFKVTLPTKIKTHIAVPISITVENKSNETITNYNNSSSNLSVTFKDENNKNIKAQYTFEIENGIGKGTVIFLEPAKGIKVDIQDTNFSNIDADDTPTDDRIVNTDNNSSSSSDVTQNASKYWAGVGTNEPENNPTKNTVESDIKQNVKKDLHFQKITW